MTHEYVIALNGAVAATDEEATAIGWAADAVLAVGNDDTVRAISRGDSTFLDLGGCLVTPLTDGDGPAGDQRLEPGSDADLAFWREDHGSWRLVATVRGGAFTEGDEHRGPFPVPPQP